MRLRDLKDALKGTRKRAERAEARVARAEALLDDTLVHIQAVYDCEADGYTTGKLHAKIEEFLGEAIDTH